MTKKMISGSRNDTIPVVDRIEYYLEKAVRLLKEWLPEEGRKILTSYNVHRNDEIQNCELEEDDRYTYLIFSWNETKKIERNVLLVYEQEQVIADLSFLSCDTASLLFDQDVYDFISEESDWMYLCHYVLCGMLYPKLKYPPCEKEKDHNSAEYWNSISVLFSNAYVTKAYRRQGIFTHMMLMSRDYTLRKIEGHAEFNEVISLDPDIAVYGPDAVKEPYHYSFEKDEPVRKNNAEILEHLGFVSTKLLEDHPQDQDDGTKLWFAVKRENDILVDRPYLN